MRPFQNQTSGMYSVYDRLYISQDDMGPRLEDFLLALSDVNGHKGKFYLFATLNCIVANITFKIQT